MQVIGNRGHVLVKTRAVYRGRVVFTFCSSCVAPAGLTVMLWSAPHRSYRNDVTATEKNTRTDTTVYTWAEGEE